jgi:hypothetical protein
MRDIDQIERIDNMKVSTMLIGSAALVGVFALSLAIANADELPSDLPIVERAAVAKVAKPDDMDGCITAGKGFSWVKVTGRTQDRTYFQFVSYDKGKKVWRETLRMARADRFIVKDNCK